MPSLRWVESLQMLAPGVAGVVYLRSGAPGPAQGLFLLALFLHILFAYTFNDLCDYALDRAHPGKRSDRPSERALRTFAALLGIAAVGAAAALPLPVLVGLLGLQALWVCYSAPVVRLKARIPFAHLLHVAAGTSYCALGVLSHGDALPPQAWIYAAWFGCLYWVGALAGELTDAAPDRRSGLRTLGGVLGLRAGVFGLVSLQVLALGCLAFSGVPGAVWLGAAGACVYAVALVRLWPATWDLARLAAFRRFYRVCFSALTAGAVLLSVVA